MRGQDSTEFWATSSVEPGPRRLHSSWHLGCVIPPLPEQHGLLHGGGFCVLGYFWMNPLKNVFLNSQFLAALHSLSSSFAHLCSPPFVKTPHFPGAPRVHLFSCCLRNLCSHSFMLAVHEVPWTPWLGTTANSSCVWKEGVLCYNSHFISNFSNFFCKVR